MSRLSDLAHRLRIDAHAVWLAARDPAVPWPVRLFGLFLAAYALSPIDLIPDFIPVLGLLDDAIILPAGVWLFVKLVPRDLWGAHKQTAEATSHRPVSRWGAVGIALLWIVALGWVALLVLGGRYY